MTSHLEYNRTSALLRMRTTKALRHLHIVLGAAAIAFEYSLKSAEVLWADKFGAPDGDELVVQIAKEGSGGVYATSSFYNRQKGPGKFLAGVTNTPINADTGAVIGKWNHLGACEWLRIAEPQPAEDGMLPGGVVTGMAAVHPDNSIFWLVSANNNRVSIEGVTYTNQTIVQKLSSTGQTQWTRSQDGPRTDFIAADLEGNYAILRRPNTESGGIAIEKYSDSGSSLWTRVGAEKTSVVGGGSVLPRALRFDQKGEMRIMGLIGWPWSGVLRFGNLTLEGNQLRNLGFLIALRPDGSDKWAVAFRGSSQVLELSSAQVASNGDTYVCGYYSGSLAISDKMLSSPGRVSSFVSKMDADGNLVWVVDTNGLDSGSPTVYFSDISVDADNSCYISGSFQGVFHIGNVILQGPGNGRDRPMAGVVAKLGTDGTPVWARQFGGELRNDTRISTIVATAPDELTLGGIFSTDVVKFGDYVLLPSGKYQGFVTRLSGVPAAPALAPTLLAPRLYFGMTLSGLLNRTYEIQVSDSLNGPNWSSVTNLIIDQSPKQWVDPEPISPLRQYYRAILK